MRDFNSATYLRDEYELPKQTYADILAAHTDEAIKRALLDPRSPFAEMIGRARGDFVQAIQSLINADLHHRDGVATARKAQADAKRYLDLISYVADAHTRALSVDQKRDLDRQLKDEEGEALHDEHHLAGDFPD